MSNLTVALAVFAIELAILLLVFGIGPGVARGPKGPSKAPRAPTLPRFGKRFGKKPASG